MDKSSLLGYMAGTLTTIAFVPQLVKTWRTRSATDISYGMFTMFCAGVFLWLVYGVVLNAWPVVAANAVTLVLALAILILKVRFDRLGRTSARGGGPGESRRSGSPGSR